MVHRWEEIEDPWSFATPCLLAGTGLLAGAVAAVRRRGDLLALSVGAGVAIGLLGLLAGVDMGEADGVSPRILVVEHEESCPPHLVGAWLAEAGCTLEVCRPYAGDALPALTSYDGVLVLGGEMGANDDEAVAWLGPLKAGIRDAVDAGTPLLGDLPGPPADRGGTRR